MTSASPTVSAWREKTRSLLVEIVKALEWHAGDFTCAEADAIKSLLDLHGIDSTKFTEEHSRFDDAGDAHYPPGRSTP